MEGKMNVLALDLDAEFCDEKIDFDDEVIKIYNDYEALKIVFRAAIGLYKEVEKIYTLEEYATEHIDLVKDLVGLYNHSLILETGKIFIYL